MKKPVLLILVFVMGMTMLMGCSKKQANQADQATQVDQFAELKKGETVAEIVIQGYGSIFVRFFDNVAPKAVENFVTHAKEGYYNNLSFHRIIADFMIQGGDPTGTGAGGDSIWEKEFEDEFSDELQPYRGALCMANSGPDTNGSQFFIVDSEITYSATDLEDIIQYYGTAEFNDKAVANYAEIGGTPWLNQKHTVFGQVYDGYDVLDAVAAVPVKDQVAYVPSNEVIIEKIIISEN